MPYRGYTLKELTLVPRPFNLPVECWQPIQGGSERALDFMAKHGIQGLVGGGSAEGGAMHKTVLDWQKAHAKIGKHIELGERMCFGFHFYLADSREQGIREAAKYYEENMKMFGELRLVRALTDEQIVIMRDPKRAPTAKLPRIEDAVKAGGFLCGNADDLIGHIKALEKKYPALDRVSVSLSVGVPKALALEQLERFATEVMPAFMGPRRPSGRAPADRPGRGKSARGHGESRRTGGNDRRREEHRRLHWRRHLHRVRASGLSFARWHLDHSADRSAFRPPRGRETGAVCQPRGAAGRLRPTPDTVRSPGWSSRAG